MICDKCLEVIKNSEAQFNGRGEHCAGKFEHHQTYRELDTSTRQNCYMCCRLSEAFNINQYPPSYLTAVLDKCLGIDVLVIWDGCDEDDVVIQFLFGVEEAIHVLRIDLKIVVSSSLSHHHDSKIDYTGSELTLDQICQWLNTCLHEHDECQQARSQNATSFHPDRLIDLDPAGHPEDYWKLVEYRDNEFEGSYVTLSHRWGPEQNMVRLTSHTRKTMMNGLPISILPISFQETINVVKRMKMRYLWIDSICIVQDADLLDVSTAAQQMSDVYYNATFNISCLTADTSSIFSFRSLYMADPLCLYISQESADLQQSYLITDECLWRDIVPESPLSKRGWIYQEQVLAKRTVAFGKSQVFWSCPTGQACELLPVIEKKEHSETQPIHDLQVVQDIMRGVIERSNNMTDQSGVPKLPSNDLHSVWTNIVKGYSGRDLTFPEDKLLAISGMARPLAVASGDQYCAGLWRSMLPFYLTWNSRDASRKRLSTYRAPTWSWASIDGWVRFEEPSFGNLIVAEILDVRVTACMDNLFDRVTDGYLRIRAPFQPINLTTCRHTGDTIHATLQTGELQEVFRPRKEQAVVNIDDLEQTYNDTPMIAIFIYSYSNESGAKFDGLVVQKFPFAGPVKAYKRVGIFQITCNMREEDDSWFRTIWRPFPKTRPEDIRSMETMVPKHAEEFLLI